jgi:hypothetical protein
LVEVDGHVFEQRGDLRADLDGTLRISVGVERLNKRRDVVHDSKGASVIGQTGADLAAVARTPRPEQSPAHTPHRMLSWPIELLHPAFSEPSFGHFLGHPSGSRPKAE